MLPRLRLLADERLDLARELALGGGGGGERLAALALLRMSWA